MTTPARSDRARNVEPPTARERADALRLLGKLTRAAAMYEVLARDPAAPAALRTVLCQLYLELGDYRRCLVEAERLAAAEPESPNGQCGAALVSALTGDLDAGIAALGKLVGRHPTYQPGYALRAHLCRLVDYLTIARDDYTTALRLLSPPFADDAGLRLGRAYVHARLGAGALARVDYRRATALAPDHPMASLVAGVLKHPVVEPPHGLSPAIRAIRAIRATIGSEVAARGD